MLVLKAEAPAGLTIPQAIRDALNLSRATNCIVSIELNDISMTIVDSPAFGRGMDERVETFYKEFQYRIDEKNSGILEEKKTTKGKKSKRVKKNE